MTTVQWILCATDLSPGAHAALEQAQRLGRLFHADVVLLHVLSAPVTPVGPGLPPILIDDVDKDRYRAARRELDRLVASRTHRCVTVTPRIELGPPARRVLAIARERPGAVIVLGSSARDPLRESVLGRGAGRILAEACGPVLTVPPGAGAAPRPASRIARIAYATDFSPAATAAWPWAVAIAEAAGAEIDVLHVAALPAAEPGFPAGALGRIAQHIHEQAVDRVERFLHAHRALARRPDILIARGWPAEEILRWTALRAADVTVMGTHGRSALARWALGSVAEHVVQASPCAVLTVGPGVPDATATSG